jgi:hypothetical protein
MAGRGIGNVEQGIKNDEVIGRGEREGGAEIAGNNRKTYTGDISIKLSKVRNFGKVQINGGSFECLHLCIL